MHLRRQKNRALTVALVGYTNAGKSTLMNALTDAGVLVADQLFATLDPTARRLVLPSGRQVMLVDTVGLVQRLPHELVDAFRSTLAEAAWADVILDVCDASDPACNSQMQVTAQVLDSLSCGGKPLLHVLNKCDRVPEEERFPLLRPACESAPAPAKDCHSCWQRLTGCCPGSGRERHFVFPLIGAI